MCTEKIGLESDRGKSWVFDCVFGRESIRYNLLVTTASCYTMYYPVRYDQSLETTSLQRRQTSSVRT